ncbi:MAG: glutathione peroxidase [Flavisolibacter sp.]
MNLRQRVLKLLYPAFTSLRRSMGHGKMQVNAGQAEPQQDVFDFSVELINGKTLDLRQLKGRKIMVVNTASLCGYTAQFDELQKLYQHSKEDLEIIAFPSNDFGEQEKGSDQEIADFCINSFSIRFPLARKTSVKKSAQQHPLFQWLTDKNKNGWNEQAPTWNFSKYLIDENGRLTHYFDPAVSPLSDAVRNAVHH